jgi:hypothetical protein
MAEVMSEDVSGMIVWKRFQESLTTIREELSSISSSIDPNDSANNVDNIYKLDNLKESSADLQRCKFPLV